LIKLFRKAHAFWRRYGTKALIRRIRAEFAGQVKSTSVPFSVPFVNAAVSSENTTDLIRMRFEALSPLPTYLLPATALPRRRVNIVTDSISPGSLFGGVGTALIFSTILANKLGADLRIITRTEKPKPDNVGHVLSVYGIELKGELQFIFLPPHDLKQSIDFCESDIFITTSWWTTAATLRSVAARSIIYLLQEDERMFYPFGDDRFKCEEILCNQDIRFLINSRLLFDHLISEGLPHVEQIGYWFEPAFPSRVYYPRNSQRNGKKKFIFYARPNNLRNLFYLGVEVINAAIAQNVFDLNVWEIIFVGKDIPNIILEAACTPSKFENMSWSEYAELVGNTDLGLCLMYTPHPSYPPLDLAASGAVVVTNRFANKQNLSQYSENLICADLNQHALVEALRKGVSLANNSTKRNQNFKENGLASDWHQSFDAVIGRLCSDI
jgi:hypothetical protein